MRLAGVLLGSALISAAQIPPQNAPLLRGVILERDAQTDGGEFSVNANEISTGLALWTANAQGEPPMRGTASW